MDANEELDHFIKKAQDIVERGLDELPHFVRKDRQRDLLPVGLTAQERFGKLQGLLGLNLRRVRHFERIDSCFDDDRTGRRQRFFDGPADAHAFDVRPPRAASHGRDELEIIALGNRGGEGTSDPSGDAGQTNFHLHGVIIP